MILKGSFLTQSTPDTCCKLQKQAFGPNQSLEKMVQLAQTICYGRDDEEDNRKKEPGKRLKPQQWPLDLL